MSIVTSQLMKVSGGGTKVGEVVHLLGKPPEGFTEGDEVYLGNGYRTTYEDAVIPYNDKTLVPMDVPGFDVTYRAAAGSNALMIFVGGTEGHPVILRATSTAALSNSTLCSITNEVTDTLIDVTNPGGAGGSNLWLAIGSNQVSVSNHNATEFGLVNPINVPVGKFNAVDSFFTTAGIAQRRVIIVGDDGYMAANTNSDLTSYARITLPAEVNNRNIKDIAFLTATTVIAVGSDGLVLTSSNSGVTWQVVDIGVTVTINKVCGSGANAIIAGENGVAFRTPTFGNTWFPVYTGLTDDIISLTLTMGAVYLGVNRWFGDLDRNYVTVSIINGLPVSGGYHFYGYNTNSLTKSTLLPTPPLLLKTRGTLGNITNIRYSSSLAGFYIGANNESLFNLSGQAFAGNRLTHIVSSPQGVIIGAGAAGQLLTSLDGGVTWELSRLTSTGLTETCKQLLCSENGTFIYIANSNQVYRRPADSTSWSDITSLARGSANVVLYGTVSGNNFVLNVNTTNNRHRLSTDDGLTWSSSSPNGFNDNSIYAVSKSGRVIIITEAGEHQELRYSDNGLGTYSTTATVLSGSGSVRTNGTVKRLITNNAGVWVYYDNGGATYVSSDDGLSWSFITASGLSGTEAVLELAPNRWRLGALETDPVIHTPNVTIPASRRLACMVLGSDGKIFGSTAISTSNVTGVLKEVPAITFADSIAHVAQSGRPIPYVRIK